MLVFALLEIRLTWSIQSGRNDAFPDAKNQGERNNAEDAVDHPVMNKRVVHRCCNPNEGNQENDAIGDNV